MRDCVQVAINWKINWIRECSSNHWRSKTGPSSTIVPLEGSVILMYLRDRDPLLKSIVLFGSAKLIFVPMQVMTLAYGSSLLFRLVSTGASRASENQGQKNGVFHCEYSHIVFQLLQLLVIAVRGLPNIDIEIGLTESQSPDTISFDS